MQRLSSETLSHFSIYCIFISVILGDARVFCREQTLFAVVWDFVQLILLDPSPRSRRRLATSPDGILQLSA